MNVSNLSWFCIIIGISLFGEEANIVHSEDEYWDPNIACDGTSSKTNGSLEVVEYVARVD